MQVLQRGEGGKLAVESTALTPPAPLQPSPQERHLLGSCAPLLQAWGWRWTVDETQALTLTHVPVVLGRPLLVPDLMVRLRHVSGPGRGPPLPPPTWPPLSVSVRIDLIA
jgi:hypothetical protein